MIIPTVVHPVIAEPSPLSGNSWGLDWSVCLTHPVIPETQNLPFPPLHRTRHTIQNTLWLINKTKETNLPGVDYFFRLNKGQL